MTETTEPKPVAPVTVTTDLVKANLKLALNQEGFQKFQDEADALIFNEDNLNTIADFLKRGRAFAKVVENAFKKGKAPHLAACKIWDTSRNEIDSLVTDIVDPKQVKYDKLCKDIAEQKRLAKIEEDRIKAIKDGIDSNVLAFSQKIAGAETLDEVLKIESLINLQKGNKSKYQEFLPDAVTAFNTLTVNIKDQKEKIRSLDALKKQEAEATASGDEEQVIELREQIEEKKTEIEEKKEQIQLDAIDVVTNKPQTTTVWSSISPKLKVRYSSWKWKLSDVEELAQYEAKLPIYMKAVLDEEAIEAKLVQLKNSGELKDKEEYTSKEKGWQGITFYLHKVY